MSPSGTQSQTAVWKKFVGAVQGSLDSIYATRNNWRASSLRMTSPKRQPVDAASIPGTIMTAQKRQREGSAKSTTSNRTAPQDVNPVSTPEASRVKSELYRDGIQRWQELLAAGGFDMTRTELDIQWCRNYGNLGLDLWEAEIARSRAAVDVMRLNALPISYSQTSKFADDPEDAAGLEDEAERAMARLDPSKIEDWLGGIEEQSPTDQSIELEADDWDVQSLQFGESCSGIADKWIKIQLQRWDMIREKLWNETKGGMGGDSAFPRSNFVIEVDPAA